MGRRGPKPRGKSAPPASPLPEILELNPHELEDEIKDHPNFMRLSQQDRKAALGIVQYWVKNKRLSCAQAKYLADILGRLLGYSSNQPGELKLSTRLYRHILASSYGNPD